MAKNPVGFTITDTAAGWNNTDFDDIFVRKDCFLEGGLWLWGAGLNGGLGTNTTTNRSSPVQTVSGGNNWRTSSITMNHSAAIKTDGSLWLWGLGTNGRLGDNTTSSKSSPVQTVSGGTNWRQVSLGYCHTAAIKTDGTLWLWGANTYGRLGDNTTTERSSPVQTVSGSASWKQVSLGNCHSSAIKTDGSLWVWGSGIQGRLGTNSTASVSSPVQTVSGGNDWKSVSLGNGHSGAVKTDGTLWLWGCGRYGRLGDDSVGDKSSPVQTVSGGANWKQVSLGNSHTAAIKTDGSLWVWGQGGSGRLGNNSTANQSSPVQTVSGGTNWRTVSLGQYHSAAIKTDGTLWLWGFNGSGRLGDNTTTNRSSPVQTISAGNNWRAVELGHYHSSAIREDCW